MVEQEGVYPTQGFECIGGQRRLGRLFKWLERILLSRAHTCTTTMSLQFRCQVCHQTGMGNSIVTGKFEERSLL